MPETATTAHGAAAAPPAPPTVRAIPVGRPAYRRLNVYAFDPSLSLELANAGLNHVTMKVDWESDPATGRDILRPGPIGEYVEVVDVDPASDCFYAPVDLNDPYLLAQDGLAPAEGNPQFHQQMAYAVTMTTIKNFEQALGRRVLWAPRIWRDPGEQGRWHDDYVQRLRIYPHALREANAYYSPGKKALLFGYFPAPTSDVRMHLPGGMVFCCLSHDVVAHETTHALLDGMHRRFIEPSNVDVLAFHEAFADIVALFQHFSLPDVLRQQIARTRGDLGTENLLAQLAQEFGNATGLHGALRDALGGYDEATGKWQRARPDPALIQCVTEPHARGSLLVSAIFDTFVAIYKTRSADLLRIATGGTGVLPEGHLHPDLVNRLAHEAAKAAQQVVSMCIRALDYCPPVDITFGDYLRALITADYDLVRDDDLGYRVAIVESFRQHGIYPFDMRSLSVDSLRWRPPARQDFQPTALPMVDEMRRLVLKQHYLTGRRQIYDLQRSASAALHNRLLKATRTLTDEMGLDLVNLTRDGRPTFEIHSVRPARRIGPDGQMLTDLVIEITQSRPGYLDPKLQAGVDKGAIDPAPPRDFTFRGGCTLLVDLETGTVRYCVIKNIRSQARLARQRAFLGTPTDASLRATYFGSMLGQEAKEPFAFLHRMAEDEQEGVA